MSSPGEEEEHEDENLEEQDDVGGVDVLPGEDSSSEDEADVDETPSHHSVAAPHEDISKFLPKLVHELVCPIRQSQCSLLC